MHRHVLNGGFTEPDEGAKHNTPLQPWDGTICFLYISLNEITSSTPC